MRWYSDNYTVYFMEIITWTNCAEQMPPDDAEIIVHAFGCHTRHLGADLQVWKLYDHIYWTPYTKEKWEDLNNGK